MINVVSSNDKIITYEGSWVMKENGREDKGIKYYYKRIMKFLEHPFYAAVAASLSVSLILGAFNYFFSIKPLSEEMGMIENNIQSSVNESVLVATTDIKNQISSLENSVSTMQNQISSYDTEISNINENFESFKSEINNKINSINNNNINITINQTSDLAKAIKKTYSSDQTVYSSSGTYVVSDLTQIVASDLIGNEYTVEDLKNETIHFTYINENGEDVFFSGQYDENGFWNGNCIVNRYKDDKLTMIMDAIYDSGKLVNYEQVFPYTTSFGNDVWVVSKREVLEEDVRSGETFMYFRNNDYIKSFDNKSASVVNIVNTKEFLASLDLQIEGYYNGYTSEGKYNDSREGAYLVKYKEDGNVRYLYVGRTKNGVANDDTGNAWALSWGYADDGYYYYKGVFYNGTHDTPPNWKPATQEEIDAVLNPDDFNCSLQGLVSIDV